MDIEEFYDADPRRRVSAEVELGDGWTDGHGVRYELSWVEDTGELYVMREPVGMLWPTPFGGVHTVGAHSTDEDEVEKMTVAVVGHVGSEERLESALTGWQQAMEKPDSVAWLVERLRGAGMLDRSEPGSELPG